MPVLCSNLGYLCRFMLKTRLNLLLNLLFRHILPLPVVVLLSPGIYHTLPPWVYHTLPPSSACWRTPLHRLASAQHALGSRVENPLGERRIEPPRALKV